MHVQLVLSTFSNLLSPLAPKSLDLFSVRYFTQIVFKLDEFLYVDVSLQYTHEKSPAEPSKDKHSAWCVKQFQL